ncbi:MAG: hypothetical protein ACYC6N_29935 [Pirellulaceae bacterium]
MRWAVLVLSLGFLGSGARLEGALFQAYTPYYEEDGWLDVTEWFDGNDYNPTDEAWWRWDDETYDASEDVSGDRDSDSWHGYTARNENDWFYDYYDPSPYAYYDYDNNETYDFGYRYYDFDNDGAYDALLTYSDWDDDGLYEDFDYYSFTDAGTDKQRQQAKDHAPRESRQGTVTGTIQKRKIVHVRGKQQHMVVTIQPKDQSGEAMIVDLGKADELENIKVDEGTELTVQGPKLQVGKETIMLATSIKHNGETKEVKRDLRSITGKVVSTHKANIRGKEHLMAMVETSQKQKTHKIAVDLGPADRLKMDIKKDSELTFNGFPVKVKEKTVIMAQNVQQGDQSVHINRQPDQSSDQPQAATNPNTDQNQQRR